MNTYTTIGSLAASAGAGAAVMFFLDPTRGSRRRALVSDKVTSLMNKVPEAARVTKVDAANRAYGLWSETLSLFSSDEPSDQVLEARVRSNLGRVVSHPRSINVRANGGRVELEGIILRDELSELMSCVRGVAGVSSVVNNLEEHETAEGIPGLQGDKKRGPRSALMQENWSPAARLAGSVAGTAAVTTGLIRRDSLGIGIGVLGVALLARSATNTGLSKLVGLGEHNGIVKVQKTITVDAPRDVVYKAWMDYENFPFLMSNVIEVEALDDGRSHWKVMGPAGIDVEWDAEITALVPNELIAWRSLKDAAVPNAGYVHFDSVDHDATTISICLNYDPPGGAIGHAIATAFGADPKSQMDIDMEKMKHFLETGRITDRAAGNERGTKQPGKSFYQ